MTLNEAKGQVDAGHTAKHQRYRSILHYLIRKELGFYGLQAEGYTNQDGVIIVKQETSFYPEWSMLIDALGPYAYSSGWWITDDPFTDYLPPERKVAP